MQYLEFRQNRVWPNSSSRQLKSGIPVFGVSQCAQFAPPSLDVTLSLVHTLVAFAPWRLARTRAWVVSARDCESTDPGSIPLAGIFLFPHFNGLDDEFGHTRFWRNLTYGICVSFYVCINNKKFTFAKTDDFTKIINSIDYFRKSILAWVNRKSDRDLRTLLLIVLRRRSRSQSTKKCFRWHYKTIDI